VTRIWTVTLRAGTRYRLLGHPWAEPGVLERDVEVEVRRLAFERGEVAAYVLGDKVMLVEFDDERRGERTASR
jgi:hypothetical protein